MNKRDKNSKFFHYSFFPKNRKGTHVEVIISFVIFIVFVVFLLAASRPAITKQQEKSNLLEGIEYKLVDMVSADVKVITLSTPISADTCITFDTSMTDLDIGDNIVVKNSSGKILGNTRVYSDGDYITIDGITPEETFFKIYYSEEFDSITPSALSCSSAGENLGFTKVENYIFEKEVYTLINQNYDYDQLKTELEVAKDMDFTFGIVLSNGTLIQRTHEDLESNISTNIYVKDVPIQYIDLVGNINSGYLKLKIW